MRETQPWSEVWKGRIASRRTAAVRARIERLNPEGRVEGKHPRGWHPHPSLTHDINRNLMGPKQFISLNGREAYRRASHLFFNEGHRKAISFELCVDSGFKG